MQIHELNTFTGTPGDGDFLAIDSGFDTAKINAQALLGGVENEIRESQEREKLKVNQPLDNNNQPDNGSPGQALRTNGDGSTSWESIGQPSDEQTAAAVSEWLDDHPEATTTVADGSLTKDKFSQSLKNETIKDYVTPQMFGALANGDADDTQAILSAINAANGGTVVFPVGEYRTTATIGFDADCKVISLGAVIVPDPGVLIAVTVGNNDDVVHVDINGLEVRRSTYDGTTENIGFQFLACYESTFENLVSENSKYNYYFSPSKTKGFAYNVLINLVGIRGNINLIIDADKANGGYCNENVFVGGRMFTSENTQYNIQISNGDSNRFYSPSCEGTGEAAIYVNGTNNLIEYPRTEGTWSGGYGLVFGPDSDSNRMFGLRYDLHVQDNGKNNSYWNQYDGIKAQSTRVNGNVAQFIRSAASSNKDGNPIVLIQDDGTGGTLTLLKIVTKDPNINSWPIRVQQKDGTDRFYVDGNGNVYAYQALKVIAPTGSVPSIQLGTNNIYFKNNLVFYNIGGDNEKPIGHDYRDHAGNPNGAITPSFIGQMCRDTTNKIWYIAFDTTTNSWKAINS